SPRAASFADRPRHHATHPTWAQKAVRPMKREYPETPLVGVGAIIIDGDRVALVKRGRAPLAGQWSIPGGLLEVGETLRAAAQREVREETGLNVLIGDLLGVFDRVVPDEDGYIHYHYVLI